MKENWVAPYDIATENPHEGTTWGRIDFGVSAKSGGYKGHEKKPTFVNIGRGGDPDVVDLNEFLAANGLTDDFIMAIAVTYVSNTTEAPLPVGICTASDDSIQAWVNNSCVVNLSVCRGTAPSCSEVSPAVLAPGVNRITVLVWDGFGGFGFRLGFMKPDGSRFTDGDPEIEYLGASDNFLEAEALPFLRRSYPGDEFLRPNETHRVALSARGSFDEGQNHQVSESVMGVQPGDISNVSSGGTTSPIVDAPGKPVGEFLRRVIGFPCSPDNDTTFNDATSTFKTHATTGGDIWGDGDSFEFVYKFVKGDFDLSIQFSGKVFPPAGRWGKFGLMARQSLDFNSRFTAMEDHGPDLQDCARTSRRVNHLVTGSMSDPLDTRNLRDPIDGSLVCHPRFLRITRRRDCIETWVSNTAEAADGGPRNDVNWVRVFTDDWTGAPDALYLGFCNSVHNSSGCSSSDISWKVLAADATVLPEPERVLGTSISWDIAGGVLNGAGLQYDVTKERGAVSPVSGRAGGAETQGASLFTFQNAPTGPIGVFQHSHDIGERGPCTPGSLALDTKGPGPADDVYTMTASGTDIWADGDQFYFAYQAVDGDFAVETRFKDIVNAPANSRWGKYGLMARWDCRPNAAYFFTHNSSATNSSCEIDGPRTAFRPKGGVNGGNGEPNQVWWQDIFGDEPIDPACIPPCPDPRQNDLRGDERNAAPFLRMVRRGSTFYGYGSDDGQDWRILGSYAWIDAPKKLLVGVAMTSHASCAVQQVSFEGYTVGPPPGLKTIIDDAGPLNGKVLLDSNFDRPENSCPADWICNRWGDGGGFLPHVIGGRLRMGELRNSLRGSGEDTGTTAFHQEPIDPDGSYLVDFDVFFSYDLARAGDGNPPADGLTFCVLGTRTGTTFLDLRQGDRGGSLDYNRINLSLDEKQVRTKDLSLNSFAVEFDNWHNGEVINDGDGGNVSGWNPTGGARGTGTGAYHIGVDVGASIFTCQRNIQVGIHDDDLPDIYDPAGIHARVLYDHGHVKVWVNANPGGAGVEPLLVADAEIEPVELNSPEALVGFTAATGGATCVMEVDNFVLRDLLAPAGTPFHRGDSDDNGQLQLTDAVRILGFLFLGGIPPTCLDAADADGNNQLQLTDAVRILGFLFLGGAAPSPPGPPPAACGLDSDETHLGCSSYTRCQ
jgi:hypothetical protein